jgi:thiamine biosynthesis protein ThiS
MIEISLNGKPECLAEGMTVAELVRQKLPGVSRVALELNLEIVPRSQYEQRMLKAGDRVEIVRAIGGG